MKLPNYNLLWAVFVAAVALAAATLQGQNPPSRIVGSVKSVSGNSVTLSIDAGSEIVVTFSDFARILRAAPGETDLKSAVPITAAQIEVGDRVLARGQIGEGNSVTVSSAVVMKKNDIAARQQQEREEWVRGVSGIVKSVDPAAGTVTLHNSTVAAGRPIQVHVSRETKILRYAPDSVKFDDAKPGTLDQIKLGDQLRARGTKTDDETEFAAQALVSGTFRDIAGTVASTDAIKKSVTVASLGSTQTITVQVTADSQLRKLPPFASQMIARRLKGGESEETGAASNGAGEQGRQRGARSDAEESQTGGRPEGMWKSRSSGPPDFQQMLNRVPRMALSELQKGDTVMLVATEGSTTSAPSVITLLSGVDAILSAAPGGTAASTILSPWNLNVSGGDASTQ